MCLRLFGLYFSACLGILFVSILCMCCSHFSLVLFHFLYYILCSCFFPNTLVFFLYLVLLFQEGVLKISSVLLLNVIPLFSSVPRLHFRILWLVASFIQSIHHVEAQNVTKNQHTNQKSTAYEKKVPSKEFRNLRKFESPSKYQLLHLSVVCHERWN